MNGLIWILRVVSAVYLLGLSIAVSAQGPSDFLERDAFGGHLGMAPPPPSPRPIRDFMFHYIDTENDPELVIALRWTGANTSSDYHVFRQRLQLTQQVDPTGFMAFTFPDSELSAPSGWTEIATLNSDQHSFRDTDIAPVDLAMLPAERRLLSEVFCYRVETRIRERSGAMIRVLPAISPVICTRLRGLNAPTVQNVSSNPGEITVSLQDNSQMAVDGYEIQYWEDLGGAVQSVILVGDGARRHTISGLKPGFVYCTGAKTMEFHGRSQLSDIRCARTQALPEPEPEVDERTFTVYLSREIIYEGFIPYVGRFPTSGSLPSGTLTRVEGINGWPAILFVKPGHSTAECGDEDALVLLSPGEALSDDAMTDAFGSAAPDLPVLFVACVASTPTLLDLVPFKITYIRD